jgi:hypothetical protein
MLDPNPEIAPTGIGDRPLAGHPGVPASPGNELVVASPRPRCGRRQRKGSDHDATLGEPACKEREIQIDQGLASVECDNRRLDRLMPAGLVCVVDWRGHAMDAWSVMDAGDRKVRRAWRTQSSGQRQAEYTGMDG